MIYFTADQHEGHKNILKYCPDTRPFENTYFARSILIKKHNEVITDKDEVYHLGDVSWQRDEEKIAEYLDALNGKQHLIIGNHDYAKTLKWKGWKSVQHYKEITIQFEGNKYPLVLFHYPIASWNRKHWGSIHLHGHSHSTYPPLDETGNRHYIKNMLDVGVDCSWTEFAPVNIEQIIEEITIREMRKK